VKLRNNSIKNKRQSQLIVREAGEHEFDERYDDERREREQEQFPIEPEDEHARAVREKRDPEEPQY